MAKTAWLFCLCMLLLPGLSVRAQTYSLTADPSADVLTLTFPGKAPVPTTLRTGPRQVEMLFPAGTKLAPVPARPGRGRHIMGLGVADNVLAVHVAQEAFGFVASPEGDNTLRLQVFYDPAGARWTPQGPAAAKPAPDRTQNIPQPGASRNQTSRPQTGQAPASQDRANQAPQGPNTPPPAPSAQAPPATGATPQAPGTTPQAQPSTPAPPAASQAAPARAPASRVVRQPVDFSATPPQPPADAASSSGSPTGQPPPAPGQGAEPISGPARQMLAPASGNTVQGQVQSTAGPGPMAQRLRQSQAQAPAQVRTSTQTTAQARPTAQAPAPPPAQTAGQPRTQAQTRPSQAQVQPQGPVQTQARPTSQTTATAQAPAQAQALTPAQGSPQAQASLSRTSGPSPAVTPAAAPTSPKPVESPQPQARPQAGPMLTGKIQLGPPPGVQGTPAGQTAQTGTSQPQGQPTTGQPVAPSAAGAGATAVSPGSGQPPASSRGPGQVAAGQVAGHVAGQAATPQGQAPSPQSQAAPTGQAPAATGKAPGQTPAPDQGAQTGPQGQSRQPQGQASPQQPTQAPQGQAPAPQAQPAPASQGQGEQAPAKPRAPGVRGAVNLTPEPTPPAAEQAGQAPAAKGVTGQVQAGRVQTGQASAGPEAKAPSAESKTPPAEAKAPAGQAAAKTEPGTPTPAGTASPGAAPSMDLGAPAKKPTPPRPEAFTLPAPGQEPQATDTVDTRAFLIEGEQTAARGDFDKAESIFRTILANQTISPFMRESALYDLADLLFNKHREHITDFYELIDSAYQEALNYNTTSRNIPRALINLGYLNLRMGNLPEARAYFSLLKDKYPLDENIPLIDVYWGQYYLGQAKKGNRQENLNKASQSFRNVLQKAPESKYAKDSALGLATTLLELQQYAEASKVLEYVDKRWPQYYLQNPSLRRVTADVAYKMGDYEKAKDQYLWFMNLVPKDETMDIVLARLGDVYARLDKRAVARQFYEMAIKRYPGSEGALMSLMRLAEQGVHDSPTTQEMFKAFASPQDVRPDQIYEMLVKDYPKSSIAPLALLKLAMWRLYKQQYPETLDRVLQFTTQYPGDELEKQAVEVGGQAYLKMLPTLMDDSNYKSVVDIWNKYPFLAKNPNLLPNRDRLALALSQYYTGHPREALQGALPFLDQGPTEDAQKALALVLTIYRENQDWKAILDTLHKVSGWKLAENPRRVLQFAQAMALEHTGDLAKSRLLWGRLAMDPRLDPAKRAYAMYYQARTAMDRGDNDKAAEWGQEARTLFEEAAKDPGKAQDALLLVIEAMQAGARFQEALDLCKQYAESVPKGSPQAAANSFRMAKLYAAMGDRENWRKTLETMRDTLGDSLYAKMAASELTTNRLEQRAGALNPPPK